MMCIRSVNKIVDYLQNNMNILLKYLKHDVDSIHLRVYSGVSYVNNADRTSQLGFIIFLMDKVNKCQPIHLTSYKCEKVCRSLFGSEVMAFVVAFDLTNTIKSDLQNVLCQTIPLLFMTDSVTLFVELTKSTMTTEKLLMNDLQTVEDSYRIMELKALRSFDRNFCWQTP